MLERKSECTRCCFPGPSTCVLSKPSRNNQKRRTTRASILLGVAGLKTTVLMTGPTPLSINNRPFFNTFVFPAMPRISVNEELVRN